MISHTARPPRLLRYNTQVDATETSVVETIELHPNSALSYVAKGDEDYTLKITHVDPADNEEFDTDEIAVTSADPAHGFIYGAAGAVKISITAGGSNVLPDLRVYGAAQQ